MRRKPEREYLHADPTAIDAIYEVDSPHSTLRPTNSILEIQKVEPLSKFNDPKSHKGRRRILRNLNMQIPKLKPDDPLRKKLIQDRQILEKQQFRSRTFDYETR